MLWALSEMALTTSSRMDRFRHAGRQFDMDMDLFILAKASLIMFSDTRSRPNRIRTVARASMTVFHRVSWGSLHRLKAMEGDERTLFPVE